MCESVPPTLSLCTWFGRARYKQTARKTVRTAGKTTADGPSRRPPAQLITRSSGAPTRKSDNTNNSSNYSNNNSNNNRGTKTASSDDEGGLSSAKKRKRFRPGALALKEIRQYQNSTELLVPRASFQRIVKEIATSIIAGFRFQSTAIIALHFAAEAYAVSTKYCRKVCASIPG